MDSIVKEGSLGDILFKCQIISEDDIRAALDEQKATGARIGEALVKLGVVTQEDIDWALSNQLNIPYVRLKPAMVDRGAVDLVPAALARQFNLIPLIRAGDEISIAIADPLNLTATAAVEKATGCGVSVSVALLREIREMQELFYGPSESAESLGFTSAHFPVNILAAINQDLTGAKLVDYLLLFILQQKLASLSLQPLGDAVSVVCRRGGATREVGKLSSAHYPDIVMRVRKLAKIGGADFAARGSIGFGWKGRSVPFQVALLRGEGGDHLTFRMHIVAPFPTSVADMGLSEETVLRFSELAAAGRGMVLASARDSEVRSRVIDLYLQEYDTAGKTVIILGNGPGQGDKRFPRVPLPPDAEMGAVVMAALEHDPDILVLEDVTEGQVFSAACRAAIRGKLVVAGIGFGDAGGALKQLIAFRDMHLIIPAHLRGLIVCRGVRTLCPECRRSEPLPPEERAGLGLDETTSSCQRAVGCPACDQTGYNGRRYLLDVIPFDLGMRERFETDRDGTEVLEHMRELGWRGIAEEGKDLLAEGTISLEEYVTSLLT
ncbi:MAG: pilus assembly protein PilB [Desulfuromonadales bacterium]|nr:MAG: pilus assembly protein PilB [Desulfuromonadales bacterium]